MIRTILICLGCVLAGLCGLQAASSDKAEKGQRKILINPDARDLYSARQSGNWNGDIWCLRRANMDEGLGPAKRGARPQPDTNAELNGPGITITLSDKVTVNNFRIMRDKGRLIIKKGGQLTLEKAYDGQGGFEASGEIEVQEGATVTVTGAFCVAGANSTDNGMGTFTQNGGDVTVNGTVFLTGPRPLSSSAQAVGVYALNNGVLNIIAPERQVGLRDGIGKGKFNFVGGTLNTNACDLDILNTGSGNFSPGGDETVGATVLKSDAARTYEQGKRARFTVNVAGRNKHDQLIWKNRSKNAKVVFEDGATIWVSYLDNYRAASGSSFDIVECDQIEVRGQLKLDGPAARDFSYEVMSGPRTGLRLKYGPGR